jgi:hypothetical protein
MSKLLIPLVPLAMIVLAAYLLFLGYSWQWLIPLGISAFLTFIITVSDKD